MKVLCTAFCLWVLVAENVWSEATEEEILELMIAKEQIEKQRDAWRELMAASLTGDQIRQFLGWRTPVASGAEVDLDMVITHVEENSPAHTAGLQRGDRVLEINAQRRDHTGGVAQLRWAFRRLHPGDVAAVQVQRGEQMVDVQVDVISQDDFEALYRENRQLAAISPEEEKAVFIGNRQEEKIWQSHTRFGAWDGLLFATLEQGMHSNADHGVMVFAVEDRDHALKTGDVITHVGRQAAKDAVHTVELLYQHDDAATVPLRVTRAASLLKFELPYPAAERFSEPE